MGLLSFVIRMNSERAIDLHVPDQSWKRPSNNCRSASRRPHNSHHFTGSKKARALCANGQDQAHANRTDGCHKHPGLRWNDQRKYTWTVPNLTGRKAAHIALVD